MSAGPSKTSERAQPAPKPPLTTTPLIPHSLFEIEHSVRRDRAQCSFLGEEVRPDSADGAAGEDPAKSTGDELPGRFNHRLEHFRPVEIQFHFCFPFFG